MAYSYESILRTTGAVALGVFGISAMRLTIAPWTLWRFAFLVLVGVLSILLALVCQYLSSMKPCDSLSWSAFFRLAKFKLIGATLARYVVWDLKRTYKSSSAMRAKQEATLMQLVKQSRDTVFGRDHKFAEIRGIEDYRDRVPVRDYAQLDKYNQLAYKGEPNVFFPGQVEFLCKTSGTTGKNKTFPTTARFIASAFSLFLTTLYCQNRLTEGSGRRCSMARQLLPAVHQADRKNEHGVPIGPLSKFFSTFSDIASTPDEALKHVHDTAVAFYIHAVFALWRNRIGDVHVFFPTTLITFIRCVGSNWDSILTDIETGRLNPGKVNVDPDLLNRLNQKLSPKPERAAKLRQVFGDGTDLTGFFEKAWPDIPCIILARSGSFQSSYRYLKRYLGSIPTYGSFLGGTEGFVGINLTDSNVDYDSPELYHPLMTPSFVEFVPVDANGRDLGQPRLIHELEVGGLYETVQTSYNCFRLRTGDVIRVVKKDACAPVFEISHRKSHVLTVHVEKTTEKSLQLCTLLISDRLDCQIVDFTAADCFLYEPVSGESRGTKYYAMFLELGGDRQLTEDEKQKFDVALRESAENYDLFRSEGHIDAMQVMQVRRGAFAELRARMMKENRDISENQFKMPRVLRTESQVRCLLEHRL